MLRLERVHDFSLTWPKIWNSILLLRRLVSRRMEVLLARVSKEDKECEKMSCFRFRPPWRAMGFWEAFYLVGPKSLGCSSFVPLSTRRISHSGFIQKLTRYL